MDQFLITFLQVSSSRFLNWLKKEGGSIRKNALQCVYDTSKDLEMVKTVAEFLHITTEEVRASKVFNYEAPLELRQWLADTYQLSKDDAVQAFVRVCGGKVRKDSLDTARWLIDQFQLTREDLFPAKKMPDIFLNACASGNLELVKWLIETYQLTLDEIEGYTILILEYSLNPELVEYLIKTFTFERNDALHVFGVACARGQLATAKLLAESFEFTAAEIRKENFALRHSRDREVTDWLLINYYTGPPIN